MEWQMAFTVVLQLYMHWKNDERQHCIDIAIASFVIFFIYFTFFLCKRNCHKKINIDLIWNIYFWFFSLALMIMGLPLTTTSHHFHPSLSPVISLSLDILHEWMRTQMLAKPSSNLLQRTGSDHWGSRAQPGWRTFMMTCLCWILGYTRLEIWCKIGLSADWCLCTVLCCRAGACYCWIAFKIHDEKRSWIYNLCIHTFTNLTFLFMMLSWAVLLLVGLS